MPAWLRPRLSQYLDNEIALWPPGVGVMYARFVFLVSVLKSVCEEAFPAAAAVIDDLIDSLLQLDGIAVHMDRPFPVGGPGVHPWDITSMSDALVGVRVPYFPWERVQVHLHRYATELLNAYRCNPLPPSLLATSGSARARSSCLGIDLPTGEASFIQRPRFGFGIPRLLNLDNLARNQLHFANHYGLPRKEALEQVCNVFFVYGGPALFPNVSLETCAEWAVHQGGYMDQRYKWHSLASILWNSGKGSAPTLWAHDPDGTGRSVGQWVG